jgi:hypothetical protein
MSDRVTGWPVLWLCQIAAAIGQDALSDADRDALQAAAAVLFQVELALESVVDRLDELSDRLQQRLAASPASDRLTSRIVHAGTSVKPRWPLVAAQGSARPSIEPMAQRLGGRPRTVARPRPAQVTGLVTGSSETQ